MKYKEDGHCTGMEYESSDHLFLGTNYPVRGVFLFTGVCSSAGTLYLCGPLHLFLIIYVNLNSEFEPESQKVKNIHTAKME